MRITEAAARLGISPRMLRYRESLGLLPAVRPRPVSRRGAVAQPAPNQGTNGQRADGQRADGRRADNQRAVSRRAGVAPGHRQFGAADLDSVALGIAIERRYDISPAELAFGLRVLADPATQAQVAELGRRIGRIRPLPAMAMDFEKERAARFLGTG